MGLKKGEKIKELALIEVVSVRREPLGNIDQVDCNAEGRPDLTLNQFIDFFADVNDFPVCDCGLVPHLCRHMREREVNRIEFRYLEQGT